MTEVLGTESIRVSGRNIYHTIPPGTRLQVTEIRNPMTGTSVRLQPPAECSEEEFKQLMLRFVKCCAACWDLAKIDPEVIEASRGWNLGSSGDGD